MDRATVTNHGEAGLLTGAVQCFSWSLHLMYTYLLYHRLSLSVRGPWLMIVAWSFCLLVNIVEIRTAFLEHSSLEYSTDKVFFGCAVVSAICQAIYLLSLLPAGDQRSSQYQEFSIESDPLFDFRQRTNYGGFLEDNDPHYLGVAKEESRVGFLNKVFFRWVDPLIKKAYRGNMQNPDDVFDLPETLTPHHVAQGVKKEWESLQKLDPVTNPHQVPKVKLTTLLYKCFGNEFFMIGILKFMNDCAGFAGPILLNCVVSFMENKDEKIGHGYLYAGLLALSTFVGALCSCHFNLLMNELGLKVRAAMTTAVYQKTVSVSKSSISKFSTGQVINFMSTDTDRIVNFSPSLHAAWSLPFQFGVTLILLYQQVGISFLTGLGFTILIMPVNKCIASKIGDLSTKMMEAKDSRVNTMSELLSGVRVIKYFNWQKYFSDRVNVTRKEELKHLGGRKYLDALCVYLWATTPVLISVLTFVTYVLLGNTLTAAKVFTSVALFAMLTGPLNAFPWVLNGLVESFVSIKRLEEFFSLPEFNPDLYFSKMYDLPNVDPTDDNDVVLKKATFVHKSDEQGSFDENEHDDIGSSTFSLNNLNITIKSGEMVGVIGPVGSGKSAFLEAILGEVERKSGHIAVNRPPRGIGYVKQEHWIQQGTVRDNILFGKAYQHIWYNKVTDACALKEDFRQLAHSDMTKVGEGGITLSGGQRARVALARAVYQDKDIYLIDDIFSAVDGHVAAQIYKKCILGLLQNKTRILCTHHNRYVSAADSVIVLQDGKIRDQGSPSRIIPLFTHKQSRISATNFSILGTPMETGRNSPANEIQLSPVEDTRTHTEENTNEEESREKGTVKFNIYKNYWKAIGKLLSPAILFSLLAMQVSRNLTDVWLAHWVSKEENHTSPNVSFYYELNFDNSVAFDVKYYLIVYGTIAVSNSIFSFMRAFLFAYGGICAAKTIHSKLLKSVMRGKILFFDTTPIGQILNRFSSDLYTVDDSLPFILNIFLANLFGVVGPLAVTMYAVPWICLLLVPLSFVYFNIQRRYRPASRDLKRIGSVAMSPIYSHFSETLSGVSTIRAMQAVPRFVRENEEKLESSMKTNYSGQAASQWLELRLQMIGCAVVAGVAIIAVIEHHIQGADPGLVGLAISYALGITGKLSGLVSSFTETEKELVAVERCVQYIEQIKPEQVKGSITSPYDWPSEGIITLKNVNLRYQEHLPRALKGVSLQTKAAEKVGIVGRTGSGKSSLFHCLYRLTEIESGEVYIDTVNIKMLDLEELREQLVIIPQEPFLFSGTIRENLDPISFCSERQLLDVVKKCKLDNLIGRLGGLDAKISDQGDSLSAGQKQLLCLARAVLSPSKVVLIDEATANVDAETDNQLQEVIQNCLADRTVLTIAHRVDTVLGCDRVFVMEDGAIVESGHPNILLQDSGTRFSKFVSNR
eukprot:GFUD01011332.1.p1 GENE.GFUD01011332.1~~GFUD01011332.1.p1  ORF type:complete len:1535 (+),score=298.00 GFUD01011332.1:327-4607(+)